MIITKELSKSKSINKDKWSTPKWLYDTLNEEFKFTLDPCAEHHTAKCKKYFTMEDNGLYQPWRGGTVFMNPPYSRGNIDKWVEKAYLETGNPKTKVVGLLPVSTSSKWFHNWIYKLAEIRFIEGRIKFEGAKYTAPFSSMVAIWTNN